MVEKQHKNLRTCEYCKVKPCWFVANNQVEYGDHCRHYKEDKNKTKFLKGR